MNVTGWLFDAYSLADKMVFWVITESGKAVRLEDPWLPSCYIASDEQANLKDIARNKEEFGSLVRKSEFISKYETLMDRSMSRVLKISLADAKKMTAFAENIWMQGEFGKYRLYNVDLLPAQVYFYEHDLFPLAFCKVATSKSGLEWEINDDVWRTDYRLPEFKSIHIDIRLCKEGKLPKFSDRLESIVIKRNKEIIEVKAESEAATINEMVQTVSEIDPDFVFSTDGDSFSFRYLIHRAKENDVALLLSREQKVPLVRPSREGTSYSSYGRIHFKPASIALLGRIHLDSENSFVWNESGMHGFFEVARICRMPLHTAFRASIGKCLSSLQFYHATKKDILIPWKPEEAEHFKTLEELLLADRGGLILVPKIGVHEKVAEFDFASLFPNIMRKKNVSAETVSCDCCPDSDGNVPELNFHTCKKRTGIVPTALEIVIKKRAEYKRLKKSVKNASLQAIYDSRQNALKWINVTSFGYLGFNNAKFGRIDSHQAVCAFDREALSKAMRTAEMLGFRILHGIVDSLWVQKRDSTMADYLQLKAAIEEATGFDISFEGEYKWIAFLHSRKSDWIPVLNRYFGVFWDGSLKVRGIEARRHDTPSFFSKFQTEILKIMSRGDTIEEVKQLMPEVQETFQCYASMLKEGKVAIEELMFTKKTSKDSSQYERRNTIENSSITKLAEEGKSLKAGQALRYVITDYYSTNPARRTVPEELISDKTVYDAKRYVELLASVCNSVTEPFGFEIDVNISKHQSLKDRE
jgi:DNA polymerase-2